MTTVVVVVVGAAVVVGIGWVTTGIEGVILGLEPGAVNVTGMESHLGASWLLFAHTGQGGVATGTAMVWTGTLVKVFGALQLSIIVAELGPFCTGLQPGRRSKS